MTKTVSTLLVLALAGTTAYAAPGTPAAPAAPASEITLYDGKAAGPATPSVTDWGGGSGQDSTETYLFGGHSLKVTTLDLFQGARITFPAPVPLVGAGRVFQLTLRRGGATLHYDPRTTSPLPPGDTSAAPTGRFGGRPGFGSLGGAGGGGGFGGPAGFGGGGLGGAGGAGGRGRGGRGRGGRRNQGGQGEAPLIPPVTELRLHFIFADGRQSDILRPVPSESDSLAGEGWYSVNVPVTALKLGAGADPQLKSVMVGGDHYGVFFVGRIKVGTDSPSGAISITGLDSALPGQPVTLTAAGASAFSANKYEWDLDEGNGADQTGETVTARYFEGGQDHTVTLTVTDLDGLRPPVTVTKVIHVKEGAGGPGGFPGAGPGGPGGFPGGRPGGPGGFPPPPGNGGGNGLGSAGE